MILADFSLFNDNCYKGSNYLMDSQSRKRSNESSHDLLSDLPLSIIHIVLALLPIRDAVRTSILSRQWRYKWASLSQLVFDDNSVSCSEESASSKAWRLKNCIIKALLLHQGPIHKFKLFVSYMNSCHHTDEWLLHLSRNDIRELLLGLGNFDGNRFQVHSSLYSCQNLTKLELVRCELHPPPPEFKGFLRLRCLDLQDVSMPSDTIESLVAKSPLLEDVTLLDSGSSELRTSAPNLKYFYLTGAFKEICLYAPLLTKFWVALYKDAFTAEPIPPRSSVCNYTQLLGGFTNLEKLRGDVYFTKFLSIGIESCQRCLVFQNLKVIRLYPVSFQDIKEISVLVRLIMGAPNLHKLKISTSYCIIGNAAAEAPHVSFWKCGCAPNFTFPKLRVVKVKDVSGLPAELEFIEFVLRRSPLLETMSIEHIHTLPTEGIRNLTDGLLRYGRASPNAEIFCKRGTPYKA